jgi:hypothetical protein
MLFERWDRSRGIWQRQPVSDLRFLLSRLAHWVYSNQSLENGVSETELIGEAVRFLYPRRYESEEEAERAAKEFVDFCRGRAWVFTDVGTTPQGVPIFKFTHKTFLEYFTAGFLVRNHPDPEELWKLLRPKIASRAWDEVAQLAFQIDDEQVEGAADELFGLLVRDSSSDSRHRWAYLSFGSRCLQFTLPSLKQVRLLAECVIDTALVEENTKVAEPEDRRTYRRTTTTAGKMEAVYGLFRVTQESRGIISQVLNLKIAEYLQSQNEGIASRTVFLATATLRPHIIGDDDSTPTEVLSILREGTRSKVKERGEQLAKTNFDVFLPSAYSFDLQVERLFQWYSPDYLFKGCKDPLFEGHGYVPIAGVILGRVINRWANEFTVKVRRFSTSVGQFVVNNDGPYFSKDAVRFFLEEDRHVLMSFSTSPNRRKTDRKNEIMEFTSDEFLGIWCLFAALSEIDSLVVHQALDKNKSDVLQIIIRSIGARHNKTIWNDPTREILPLKLPTRHVQLINNWVLGKVDFVK